MANPHAPYRTVPGWNALGDATHFNRARMAGYLGLPASAEESAGTCG